MLLGFFEHHLDSKNRLCLPTTFLAKLEKTVVLSLSPDKCIDLRTLQEFKSYANTLNEIGTNKEKIRVLQRAIFGNSFEVKIDSYNRITIPSALLKLCSIKKEVILIGVNNKLEIWDAKIYQEYESVNQINTLSSIFEGLNNGR